MTSFQTRTCPGARFAIALVLIIAGCAHVHFEEGAFSLDGKALVFGRVVLVRDGEMGTLSTFGTMITLTRIEAIDEPRQIMEAFDPSGRFYWRLDPGRYLLEIGLHPQIGEIVSLSFSVLAPSRAYYFGDLVISGEKRFDAFGAANVANPSAILRNHFEDAKTALLKRNPHLEDLGIERLEVRDMTSPAGRLATFREDLAEAARCCETPREFHFEKLGFGDSKTFEIGQKGGAFPFPEGWSYFAAFELPIDIPEYEISLRSLLIPNGIPGSGGRLFVPTIALLDEEFRIIETGKPGLMQPVPARFFPPQPACLEGQLVVSTDGVRPRYLVVYTTEALLRVPLATTAPVIVPVVGGALPTGIRRPLALEPWISGRVEITLRAK